MKPLLLAVMLCIGSSAATANCDRWRSTALANENDAETPLKLAIAYASPGSCDTWDVRLAYRYVKFAQGRGLNSIERLIQKFKAHPDSLAIAYLLASALREHYVFPQFDLDPKQEPDPVAAGLRIAGTAGLASQLPVPSEVGVDGALRLIDEAAPADFVSVRRLVLGLITYCAESGYTPAMYDLADYLMSRDDQDSVDLGRQWLALAVKYGHRTASIRWAGSLTDPVEQCGYFIAAGARQACDPRLHDGNLPSPNQGLIEAMRSSTGYVNRPSPYRSRKFQWW